MTLKRSEIVVGSSLPAVLYAFNNNLSLFYSVARRPFRFDYFPQEVDLSSLKLSVEPTTLTTFEEEKIVGVPKAMLWERLLFIMSLNGQIPLGNMCKSMRFTEDSLIFSDEYAKLIEVKFDKCHYFGDSRCSDILKENEDDPTYICYDWIAFNRGGKHKIDYLSTSDDFVKEVWFYSSDRIDGNTQVKDACIVSYLQQEQASDFNYSETMARFKLIHEMEARGMKGKFNGYGPNGKPKYYKFRTTSIGRRVEYTNETPRIEADKIETPTVVEEDLLQILPTAAKKYAPLLKYL
jgi:hypothetical protein